MRLASGDRTPKQKIKVNMSDPHVLEFFHTQYVITFVFLHENGSVPLTNICDYVVVVYLTLNY
jgi:hypothetical protein